MGGSVSFWWWLALRFWLWWDSWCWTWRRPSRSRRVWSLGLLECLCLLPASWFFDAEGEAFNQLSLANSMDRIFHNLCEWQFGMVSHEDVLDWRCLRWHGYLICSLFIKVGIPSVINCHGRRNLDYVIPVYSSSLMATPSCRSLNRCWRRSSSYCSRDGVVIRLCPTIYYFCQYVWPLNYNIHNFA